jgi:hypothetical protein
MGARSGRRKVVRVRVGVRPSAVYLVFVFFLHVEMFLSQGQGKVKAMCL